ncbi:ATP-binding protein [Nitratireductor sp. XY-223]|uniref:AAA family ATPase n=1 Tax=Nitratireductor sp. XY-223 TaxID=2561926 RepID=UPI0010AAEE1D|nr:ATP-binding protein [Nitratireductor sp. XY-223]
MPQTTPVLHLLCGKIASGKSTLTRKLGDAPRTVVISEDVWLAALFSDEMTSVSDYVRCSAKLRDAIGPHVVSVLKAGTSVVLDFPANTVANRAWMRGIFETADVPHQLHYLDVPDDVCKARLHERNRGGEHAFAVTEAQFLRITQHFAAPTAEEGFNVVHHPHLR